MYRILIHNFEKKYLLCELINMFLRQDQYILEEEAGEEEKKALPLLEYNKKNLTDRDAIKREIYGSLSALTGKTIDWGILTGIRPVKLCGELIAEHGLEKAQTILREKYLISEEKINFITEMFEYQMETAGEAESKSAGIYIGIPFCPTRCVYCSFASNQVPDSEIEKYSHALNREVEYVGKRMKETEIFPESVYIGGGTPTTFTAAQLEILLDTIRKSFDFSKVREFTVEAGRPDTITEEKLAVLKKYGVGRISINPQSMKQHTLDLIGRSHRTEDILEAFEIAKKFDFDSINADIIAGLPEETPEDFRKTLEVVSGLKADNITVHSLAVKRASKLIDIDPEFHFKQADSVKQMVSEAQRFLTEKGYRPYYLYRQKHMAGACENVGYCMPEKEGIYNIRIMDEHQIILALGAGGVSKMYYPKENRLERVPNVTNYTQYIDRLDEMLERKEKNIFMEVRKC